MRTPGFSSFLGLAALLLAAAPAAPAAAAPPGAAPAAPPVVRDVAELAAALRALPRPAAVSGGLPLAFLPRPRLDGAAPAAPAAAAPVTIRFAAPPTAADLDALRAAGADLARRPDGAPRVRGPVVLAKLPLAAVARVAAVPGVVRVALDGAPFRAPPPLDVTAAEIQATGAWRRSADGTGGLTGAGVVVCDVDSGIDAFHPFFFRADGGYHAWIDRDEDGVFTPGEDGVDLNGDGEPEPLRVLDGLITEFWNDTPRFESDDPSFALGLDWLYADVNGNGERDFGPGAGFTEADPTYGERLFVADDVNGNGVLDAGEKIVALGTSKVKAVRFENRTYRRGEDLIELPEDDGAAHGTGAAGVMVGGNPGLTSLAGIAHGAELVMGKHGEKDGDVELTELCVDEGARVVLHEYAPWFGYHLDGSSELEQLIDETAQGGVAHINPAGNLSGSQKLYKGTFSPGEAIDVPVLAPDDSGYGAFTALVMSWLWRDTGRDLDVWLEDPTGFSMQVTIDAPYLYDTWPTGHLVYAERFDSSRGTARLDVYVYAVPPSTEPVPPGTWRLHVTDPTPPGGAPLELIGFVADELSGWGKGIHFPEGASEDHLIGYPGTADLGLAVAATTGHGFYGGDPGVRAPYSGRGHRIDGASLLWISAPDDPITSGYAPGSPARYMIYGGTSGASPHVAGAAALLFEADPSRTGEDVRDAIRDGALADAAVGAAPNDDYGHGKLRVHRTLFGEDPPGGGPPQITIAPASVYAGRSVALPIEVSDPDEPAGALLLDVDLDYDGIYDEPLDDAVLRVHPDEPGRRILKVRVRDATGREAAALAVIDATEAPLLYATGGGGCAFAGARSPAWGAIAVPAMAASLLGLRRLRRRPRRGA